MKDGSWKDFERLVEAIQKQCAPTASVVRSETIVGKSGQRRHVDVSIRQQVGTYPIFIAIDCKHRKRKARPSDVGAFLEQVDDVGADLGVMVSNRGFTRTAKAAAKRNRVVLQTLEEASGADWQRVVGERSWTFFLWIDAPVVRASAVRADGYAHSVPFDILVYGPDDEYGVALRDRFWASWKALPVPRPTGGIEMRFPTQLGTSIRRRDESVEVREFVVDATLRARQWAANVNLSSGYVLRDAGSGQTVHAKYETESIDWKAVMATTPGRELTPVEFAAASVDGFSVDLAKVDRFVRFSIAHGPEHVDETRSNKRMEPTRPGS